jgi:hypothetical protein
MRCYRQIWYLAVVFTVWSTGFSSAGFAQAQTEHFQSNVDSAVKPWTSLDFYNDPMNFKFAIVSDRTGGLRPGVFADGVKKLNLLMPEFVMSVGDFIPGNTSDRAQLEKEWAEFDAVLKPLKVPFFFVPGNHDINNNVMRDVWKERSGVPFYSFVYKDVLFLALDTTGEKGDIVPDYQVEYMKKALDKHADARWTFVFMHHPLWLYDDPAGFAKVQSLLEGRQHTVIAGHFHRYLHEWRNNANYYILASTGGGSQLRGTRYGEFDHVTLVTITDDGPVMANLRLDGILPHDVTTRADYELTGALVRSTSLPFTMLTDNEDAVTAGTLYLTLRNPSENQLQVKARFMHGHEVRVEPSSVDVTLAGKSEQVLQLAIHASEPVPTDSPALIQLNWTMGYEIDEEDDLFLSGTRNIPLRPSSAHLIATVAPEFVDSLSVAATKPDEGYTLRYTTDGSTPSIAAAPYEAPFTIDEATTFKVRQFNEKGHGTATSTQSYKPVPAGTGFRYRYYEGRWTRMPDYRKLKPVFSGVATDLEVESRQLRRDNWGMILEGNLDIEKAGEYTFHLNSDDGSMLYVDDELIIDNDGDHSLLELSGAKELSAGPHQIRIEFFESAGEAILELDVEGPDMQRQALPFDRISH